MWTKKQSTKVERAKHFRRGMFRSAVVSVFWSVISEKRKRENFKLQSLADKLGIDKSVTSKWFAKHPNWQIDTIADIAEALDLDIEVRATERSTGQVFSSFGIANSSFVTGSPQTLKPDHPLNEDVKSPKSSGRNIYQLAS